jgi:hypothetical protein
VAILFRVLNFGVLKTVAAAPRRKQVLPSAK